MVYSDCRDDFAYPKYNDDIICFLVIWQVYALKKGQLERWYILIVIIMLTILNSMNQISKVVQTNKKKISKCKKQTAH